MEITKGNPKRKIKSPKAFKRCPNAGRDAALSRLHPSWHFHHLVLDCIQVDIEDLFGCSMGDTHVFPLMGAQRNCCVWLDEAIIISVIKSDSSWSFTSCSQVHLCKRVQNTTRSERQHFTLV